MRLSVPVLVSALFLAPLGSGCLVAGAVGGVVVSQELLDNNTYVSHLNLDVKQVWPIVKSSLADWSLEVIEYDDSARICKARIDGSMVTVAVETYDLDKSIMKVSARKYGVNNGEMARLITERLHTKLRN